MEYIPVLLSFLSGCVALIGNTWNPSGRGVGKLTKSGILTLVIIVFATAYLLATAHSSRVKKSEIENENARISELIDYEIKKSFGIY